MQGCLTKFRILFHCLLDGEQFMMTTCSNRNGTRFKVLRLDIVEINSPTIIRNADAAALQINQVVTLTT